MDYRIINSYPLFISFLILEDDKFLSFRPFYLLIKGDMREPINSIACNTFGFGVLATSI